MKGGQQNYFILTSLSSPPPPLPTICSGRIRDSIYVVLHARNRLQSVREEHM